MTPIAQWLNTAFAGFDYAILEFYHSLAESASPFFTPFSEFFAFIGDGAMFCFVLAALLLLFKRTRKTGLCIIFAVGVGALITNVALKNIIARPRPYASDVAQFVEWWNYIGAPLESEFSFPSGHTTSAMAGMVGLCIGLKKDRKWWIWLSAAIYVLIMGATRNYLMVHYPSDVIGGIIAGGLGGIIGSLIVIFFYQGIECNRDNKFCSFILNSDVRNLFKKKKTGTN